MRGKIVLITGAIRGVGDNLTGAASLLPRLAKPLFQNPEKAAAGLVDLASSPDLAGATGQLFLRAKAIKTKLVTRDLEVAARLWRIRAELVGLPGDLLVRSIRTPSKPLVRSAA